MKINEDNLFEKINDKFNGGNTIIFAPNGTGKSHILAKKYKDHDDCFVISSLDKTILGTTNKNKEFTLFEDKTREKLESIDNLVQEIKCSAIRKNTKKSQEKYEHINKLVKQVFENESIIKQLLKLKKDDANDNPIEAFKKFADNDSKNKSDKLLKDLFDKYIVYLEHHENKLKTCPCCDNEEFDQQKVYDKIKKLDESLTDVPSQIIEFYYENEDVREIICDFEFNDIYDEDIEKCKEINDIFAEINEITEKSLKLKNRIEHFEKYLHKFIDEESGIEIKDETIVLKFPRKITEYSSGEQNLILLILKLMEFECSGRIKLIIDDIISSVDTVHIFEMINLIGEYFRDNADSKNFLLLTHNPDILNIFSCINLDDKASGTKLNIQYFCLEKISQKVYYLSEFESGKITNLKMLNDYAEQNEGNENRHIFSLIVRDVCQTLNIEPNTNTFKQLLRFDENLDINDDFLNAIYHNERFEKCTDDQKNNVNSILKMLRDGFNNFSLEMFNKNIEASNLIIQKFVFLTSLRDKVYQIYGEKSLKKVIDVIKNDYNNKEEHKEAIQRIYILLNSSSHAANLNNHLSFAFSISIIELLNWKNIILDLEKK